MVSFERPHAGRQDEVVEALGEYAALDEYAAGSGLVPDELPDDVLKGRRWRWQDMGRPEVFADFCADMVARADATHAHAIGMVPDDKLWIVDDDRFAGFLSVRHELNDFLLQKGGHIGFSVRPTARRRGLASAACAHGLAILRGLGVDRALITCDESNEASRRTILANGGVLEDVRDGTQRYWVGLG